MSIPYSAKMAVAEAFAKANSAMAKVGRRLDMVADALVDLKDPEANGPAIARLKEMRREVEKLNAELGRMVP